MSTSQHAEAASTPTYAPDRDRPAPALEPRGPAPGGGGTPVVRLQLQLSIPELSLSDYECEAFTAEEGVSRPFRLEAFFVVMRDLTGSSVVSKPAWFQVKQNGETRVFGGVVLEFRLLNKIDVNSYTYAVVIGPRLSLLDRSRQSAVFAPDSALGVKDLLDGLLSGSLYANATVTDRGVSLDYEIQDSVSKNYKRTNITKFNESDFQFFSRVCEHYGVFYFFDVIESAGTVKDKLVVAADNAAFPASAAGSLGFKPARATVAVTQAAVTALEWVARPALKAFKLRDFSEDKPDTDMLVSSTQTAADGVGGVVEYGDHYLTRDEGEALVEIRAQEQAWQSSIFACESTACELGAGQVFALTGHDISAFNTDYVVLEMRHEAGKPGPLGYAANTASMPYRNRFTAIKKSQTFRPRRVTPRPVMAGVFNAMVEAEDTSATRAALDSSGRYRLGLGYNETSSRNTAGKGSAPVRQAQPYAGSSADSVVSGLHLPLVRNTEVLVGYVNADPDRPVILGAAFNQNNADPVTSSDQTTNVLRTTGGLLMEMQDGANKSATRYMRFDIPKAVTDAPPSSSAASGTYLRLGGHADDSGAASGLKYTTSSVTQTDNANKNEDDPYGDKASSSKSAKEKSKVSATSHDWSGKGVLLYSDDDLNINVKGAGLTKFGAGHTTKTAGGDSVHTVDKGQYKLTTLNGVTIEAGTYTDPTGVTTTSPADILIHATNTVTTKSDGDTYDWVYGNSTKYTQGNSFSVFFGTEESIKLAMTTNFQLGMKLETIVGIKMDLIAGNATKITNSDLKLVNTDVKIVTTDLKLETSKVTIGAALTKMVSANYDNSALKFIVNGTSSVVSAVASKVASTAVESGAMMSQTMGMMTAMPGLYNIM
ncbi:type VI secretion system Vgr family protein [Xanthobacter agilis]|uniref:type VI secretion system Vgr family protein n=1 Tax=Xanthobacter agilis TaxID=47492 RepID=UPI00372C4FAF